jgi:hypothetical protein
MHSNLHLIAMDEPLVSGLGPCKLSLAEVGERTHRYTKSVTRVAVVGKDDGGLLIGDIEPYPYFDVKTLELWIKTLSKAHTKPKFFHLDIDLNSLRAHPEFNLNSDLHDLQYFLLHKDIPFGIIIWSGRDPVDSDSAYYNSAMEFVRLIRASVRSDTELIFQSWVRRAPIGCDAASAECAAASCSAADPSYCGEKSVPLNLPEGNPQFYSHTKLVNDSLAALGRH